MRKVFASLISIALCLSIYSCGKKDKEAENSASPSRQNVILISIDTLRADYLNLYAPHGVATPNLESLAKEGVLFRKAISQIPYTLPSHCTLLTGLYPVAHGVKDNVHDQLPDSIRNVAEIFRGENYQTAAFLGSMVLSRQTGLSRGFDFYDDYFSRADARMEDLGAIERPAEAVFHSFEHWFETRSKDRPFFAFIHFYDPHSPYEPPGEFRPSSNDPRELYKGEIGYVDSVLGQLFSFLRQKNAWNDTIIVVTSDHGEMLNEHKEIGHGYFLYQPSLEVPLVIRFPARSGERKSQVEEMVELVDVPPTILDLAGLKVAQSMQGQTLIPLMLGSGKKKIPYAFSESYFASLQLGVSPLYSVQDAKFKYIDSPTPELYDLRSDTKESTNLLEQNKKIAGAMRQKLSEYQKRFASNSVPQERREVSAEEAERFAALGYLGGQVPETEWDKGKDPKDYIDEWNESLEATYLVNQRRFADALKLIQKITTVAKTSSSSLVLLEAKCYAGLGNFQKAEQILEPMRKTPQGLTALADIYIQSGKLDQAEAAYKQALDQQFSYFVLYNYVLLLKQAGRAPAAISLAKNLRQSRANEEEGKPFWAEILYLLEQWNDCEQLTRTLIQQRPWESKWYVQLASIYAVRGEPQKAVDLLKVSLQRFAKDPEYLLRLGTLYNRLNQKQDEVQTFQQMIQARPIDARGYFYLAKAMLDRRDDPEAVMEVVRRGFAAGPAPDMQIFGHYILANIYELTGKPAEAKKEFDLAQKLEKSYH